AAHRQGSGGGSSRRQEIATIRKAAARQTRRGATASGKGKTARNTMNGNSWTVVFNEPSSRARGERVSRLLRPHARNAGAVILEERRRASSRDQTRAALDPGRRRRADAAASGRPTA